MKCIGKSCPSYSDDYFYSICSETTNRIYAGAECQLSKNIIKIREDLTRQCTLFEELLDKNNEKEYRSVKQLINYKCPKCEEYSNAFSWDYETLSNYDKWEHEYIKSIEYEDRDKCEYYCPNCKSLINGKNIKTDEILKVENVNKCMLNNLENTYKENGLTIDSNYGLKWDIKDVNDDFICICEDISDNCIGITMEQAEFIIEVLSKIVKELKGE